MISDIKDKLIDDLFRFSQDQLLTPANMGILKSSSKNEFLEILDQVDTKPLLNLSTRDEYDDWVDRTVKSFHHEMISLYRNNLVVSEENPYSYSARMLNHYIRILCLRTWLFGYRGEKFIRIQHPIFSNKFLKTLSEVDTKKVNQITSRKDYYTIVKFYRGMVDQKMNIENKKLLDLEIGIDV